MADILIVDDEEKIGKLLRAELVDAGHKADYSTEPAAALERVRRKPPDIVLTDLRMAGMDGIELLKHIRADVPGTDVIVMTAYASLETALETMREGAYDYIIKPFQTDELLMLVSRLVEQRRLRSENEGLRSYLSGDIADEIVGSSAAMKRIKEIIGDLSASNAAVMIRGESGTGKELVARAIHRTSSRSEGPFIALNCAAIPESLLESELFGYEKGAFTGAARRKMGHFQLADRGTLFLDEIGDLPLALQAKLLRVLETRSITPLGGEQSVAVDFRIISATHQALEEEIQRGGFREDLFYRLNVFPITLPPLRDRKEDIEALATHFLGAMGRRSQGITNSAMKALTGYHWPGNIRELRNVLERAVILQPDGDLDDAHILLGTGATAPDPADVPDLPLNLEALEKEVIRRALRETGGNKSEAARLLGITRRALYGRLERYGID